MIDLYLKFTDEAQAIETLYTEVPVEWNEEGEPTAWTMQANYQNIDTIGTIYQAQEDPEVEPIPYEGWFVNVRVVSEDPEPLMPFSIDPEPYPMRVWG